MVNYFLDIINKYASFTCSRCAKSTITVKCATFERLEVEHLNFCMDHAECELNV